MQFHLGEALFALDRPAEARARFQRAVELADAGAAGAELPQIAAARARIVAIDAASAAPAVAAEGPATDG